MLALTGCTYNIVYLKIEQQTSTKDDAILNRNVHVAQEDVLNFLNPEFEQHHHNALYRLMLVDVYPQ
jgi:hypothetical protein